jgi:replication factor A1
MVNLKDLQPKQGNVDVVVDVIDIGPVREFEKFGKSGRVANAVIRDITGELKLTLWNEQIEQIKVGDKIRISNGYVGEFRGELQLSTGKFGKLEVVGSAMVEEKPIEKKTQSPAIAVKKAVAPAAIPKEDMVHVVEEDVAAEEGSDETEDLDDEVVSPKKKLPPKQVKDDLDDINDEEIVEEEIDIEEEDVK